ncbi:MAG: HAMP domain-containing histidine kinase [Oligoflexia bacterium]|nr:HAMP domain-containing histidine kinase [Oligoflexia bacterium]
MSQRNNKKNKSLLRSNSKLNFSLNILAGISFILVVSSAIIYQRTNYTFQKIANVNDGINTCFYRVVQSFLASTNVGTVKSLHLKDSFLLSTQECFSELISEIENNYLPENVALPVNKMANEVFEFQKMITEDNHKSNTNTNTNTNTNNNINNANTNTSIIVSRNEINLVKNENNDNHESNKKYFEKFAVIENIKFNVAKEIEKQKKGQVIKLSWVDAIFYLTLTFFTVVYLIEMKNKLKVKAQNIVVERAAENEMKNEIITGMKVEEIVKKGLENNDLFILSKLFNKYHSTTLENALLSTNASKSNNKLKYNKENQEENEMKEPPPMPIDQLKWINLSDVLTKLIQLFSQKLFLNGIVLKMDIEDNIYVRGDENTVNKIFYHLLTNIISLFNREQQNKLITISNKIVREVVILELSYNVDNSWIDLSSNKDVSASGIKSCKMLLEEIGGKLIMASDLECTSNGKDKDKDKDKDKENDNSNLKYNKIDLYLQRVDQNTLSLMNVKNSTENIENKPNHKLVGLIKGKKRDVLRELELSKNKSDFNNF